MAKIIGVRFKRAGKIYYFDPQDKEFLIGDNVIVETVRGVEFGEVAIGNTEKPSSQVVEPLKPVMRKATEKDLKRNEENRSKEKEAFNIAVEKIEKHNLEMKLTDVEYTFDGNKIIFYFTADSRVDFRELVKDLASVFRTRIELRQIGVRDQSKMIGGLGPCGRPVCCSSFLGDFQSVSIKMAKEQNLSLSPTKISGLCSRLMCCLNYEQEQYEELRSKMPKINTNVKTPDGKGTVVENNVLRERTKVKIALPDGTFTINEYNTSELVFKETAKSEDVEIVVDDEIKSILD